MGKITSLAAAVALLVGAASSLAAQAAEATPETISNTFVTDLKAGKFADLTRHFFGSSPLALSSAEKFGQLQAAIGHAVDSYGPVKSCELVDTVKRGTMVENRLYLCQHDQLVTRWQLRLMRTNRGWMGSNLTFDEKTWLPLNEN